MSARTIGDLGERAFIARLREEIAPSSDIVVGIGDDAAVLDIPDGHSLVVSTDRVPSDLLALRLELMDWTDLGRYLVEVNVSDLVAMGGVPRAFLLNISIPTDFLVSDLMRLIGSVARRGQELGAPLVGGDSKQSDTPQYVGVAVGQVERGRHIGRSGARPGDVLAVTGPIGGFGAALAYFMRTDTTATLPTSTEESLRQKLLRPTARVDLVSTLYDTCSACIDMSDGFGASLRELERDSSCEFDVDADALPLHPGVLPAAELLGIDPMELVLGIGLDLEILCCLRTGSALAGAAEVGVARERQNGSRLFLDGVPIGLPEDTFEHYSRSPADFVARKATGE